MLFPCTQKNKNETPFSPKRRHTQTKHSLAEERANHREKEANPSTATTKYSPFFEKWTSNIYQMENIERKEIIPSLIS